MHAQIDLTDKFNLLAVWEHKDQVWELISITRFVNARALCKDESTRLVFPTSSSPVGLQNLLKTELSH